jgi:NAD(P)H-dependent FMN reductase
MSDQPMRLAVIIGSVRQGRFGPTVARWFAGQAGEHPDLDVDLVDLAEFPLPMEFSPSPDTVRVLSQLTPRLAAADAIVVVTPEYNHSFPAALKNVIDWHGKEWQAKPVGFVSYGGLSGGLRAIEALRVVFAELHAVTVRDTVSFHGAYARFDEHGNPTSPAEPNAAAKVLIDQLVWWGRALREARAARPYVA